MAFKKNHFPINRFCYRLSASAAAKIVTNLDTVITVIDMAINGEAIYSDISNALLGMFFKLMKMS